MIHIQPAARWEAASVASRLRAEDEQEIRWTTRSDPLDVLLRSFDLSKERYSIRYTDGACCDVVPFALFGVCDDHNDPGLGIVWMLATPRIDKARLSCMKALGPWLDRLSSGYWGLHNIVDSRNHLHVRWLESAGFEEMWTVEVNGVPFHHMMRKTPSV